jgi:hypothetical protein
VSGCRRPVMGVWLPMFVCRRAVLGASFVDNSQTFPYATLTAVTSFVSESLASPNSKIVL